MKLRDLILEKVAELGEGTLNAFFPAKYPEARIWREILKARPSYTFSKPSFSSILSQLRKEGFVARKQSRRKSVWRITRRGLQFVKLHRRRIAPQKDEMMRVVCFDIPENQRKKRRWIREALLELHYQPIQKSVWAGFVPLAEDFFEDLDLLSLRQHIHIFSVHQKGTIEKER